MGILLEAPAGYPYPYSNGYPASRTPILILSLSCTYIFWVWVFCWKRGICICKYQQAKYILGMGFWVCCWRRSQRAMQRCLHDQLRRNMEAYIDDVIIKSQVKEDLISDLSKIFMN